jgi:hypothetical protein
MLMRVNSKKSFVLYRLNIRNFCLFRLQREKKNIATCLLVVPRSKFNFHLGNYIQQVCFSEKSFQKFSKKNSNLNSKIFKNTENTKKNFVKYLPSKKKFKKNLPYYNYNNYNKNRYSGQVFKKSKRRRLPPLEYKARKKELSKIKSLVFFHKKRLANKMMPKKTYRFRANFVNAPKLKNFIFHKKKLRARFLYTFMHMTKNAFYEYYQRKFDIKNIYNLLKNFRKKNLLTKFEKFVNFFEYRLATILIRIRYTMYMLYSNSVITNGQIRVNGNIIFYCDYQTRLCDLIEISYRAFFRHFFKRYLYRKFYKYQFKNYGMVLNQRRNFIRLLFKKYFQRLPKWLYYGVIRTFRSVRAFQFILTNEPQNDYFIQYKTILATIVYKRSKKFLDKRFTFFLTYKQMAYLSNVCLNL